ncbi:hypothetical protein M0802_008251 [Mischocyttarus mexicanus]|nr:hypothetical protein M0802_008251 [Mischocyttarus mexicanus]
MEISIKSWHSTGKLNTDSNKCIKLTRNTSWSEISTDKIKELPKYQPIRIKLPDSKSIHHSARKREPERLGVISKDKKDDSIQSNSGKKVSRSVNKCNPKIRRNLNLNFGFAKQQQQQVEKNTNAGLPEVQEKTKLVSSNSKNNRNRKSFLLPPNFIRSKYLKERASKITPLSNDLTKNDTIATNLNVTEASKNLHLKNSNAQNDNSKMDVNLKSKKRLRYDCDSKRNTLHKSIVNKVPLFFNESECIKENITTDDKIQKQEKSNVNESNISTNKNIDNLQNITNELNNVILKNESEVSVNNGTTDLSRKKDYLCVDKNTMVSLKSTLEDMLKEFQNNASKLDLLLKNINKIFHVNTDSIEEERVNVIDFDDEKIKDTSKLNEEEIIKYNNTDTVSNISKKNNNNEKIEEPVELNEEEKENIFDNLILQLDHTNIDQNKSLQLTPKVLQITIPNYANIGESAMQDYINLKASINFLATPVNTKLQPRIQKNQNVISNIPKDKSCLSNKIFTELQNLYDE